MNVDNDDIGLQLNDNDDISSTRQCSATTRSGFENYREDHVTSISRSWWRCTPIKMSPDVRVAVASSMAAVGGVMFGYDTGTFKCGTQPSFNLLSFYDK